VLAPTSPQTPAAQHVPFRQLYSVQQTLPQQISPNSQQLLPQITTSGGQQAEPTQRPSAQQTLPCGSQQSSSKPQV